MQKKGLVPLSLGTLGIVPKTESFNTNGRGLPLLALREQQGQKETKVQETVSDSGQQAAQ